MQLSKAHFQLCNFFSKLVAIPTGVHSVKSIELRSFFTSFIKNYPVVKRTLIIFFNVLIVAFLLAFTFITEPDYEKLLDEEYRSEFVANTSSESLITNLADVYSHVFDEILRVDVHRNESNEFYFVAYAKKDNKLIAKRISASEEMADNEYYPSRADMGIKSQAVVINCYCSWIFCTPDGQGKLCGVALDYESDCRPSSLCPVKKKQIDIDE